MSYEAEQSRLQRLLQEVLSDEGDSDCNFLFGDAYLSDGYQESDDAASDTDSTDSKGSFAPPRKIRHIRKSKPAAVHGYIDVPSTSSYSVNDANVNSVLSTSGQPMPTSAADTIEDVIQKFVMDSSNSDKNGSDEEIAQQNTTNDDIQWDPVTGTNMKTFAFSENSFGFSAEFHETYYNKGPLDFYLLFLNDDVLDLMVCKAEMCICVLPKVNFH